MLIIVSRYVRLHILGEFDHLCHNWIPGNVFDFKQALEYIGDGYALVNRIVIDSGNGL